jgi:hypothetical protein
MITFSSFRDMAALHFLLNIPMKNEAQIVQTHLQQQLGLGSGLDGENGVYSIDRDVLLRIHPGGEGDRGGAYGVADSTGGITPVAVGGAVEDGLGVYAPGRKLDGRSGPTVRLQPDVRFKMTKMTELSALVRQWEDTWLYSNQREGGALSALENKVKSGLPPGNAGVSGGGGSMQGGVGLSAAAGAGGGGTAPGGNAAGPGKRPQGILSSRMFHSRSRGYPVCVSSVVAYAPEAERARLERNRNQDVLSLQVFKQPVRDWRGVSYRSFLRVRYYIYPESVYR